jgi:hypothetical protein
MGFRGYLTKFNATALEIKNPSELPLFSSGKAFSDGLVWLELVDDLRTCLRDNNFGFIL